MSDPQAGILAPIPPLARYLCFLHKAEADPRAVLRDLRGVIDGERAVLGLGLSLVLALGGRIEGLRSFPRHVGPGFEVPSTPAALWCWLRGEDRGDLIHLTRRIVDIAASVFDLDEVIDGFRYGTGRDLTGYEDGTENPKGENAVAAALVAAGGAAGMAGSSFVAVQRWEHSLARFESLPSAEQDLIIGRRKSDNTEIDDAPPSSHTKRTAQEQFEPKAFVLRRSMPWADERRAGLVFTAFGNSFDAFEAQLSRMVGADDGIADALFRFTRPVSGSYFWCPPLSGGRVDLTALGL
jgi:putative iron-dependent peroxidase